MAFTQKLPDDVLKVIAGKIRSSLDEQGDDIGGVAGPDAPEPSGPPTNAPVANYTMGESFDIWTFAPDMTKEYEAGTRDLSALVRRSSLWHHQLKIDDSPEGFARSRPQGPTPDNWSLREIFWSPLAKSIDKAIDWIDDNVPDEVEARLLSVPFQHTEAFWFVTPPGSTLAEKWNDKLLVVTTPKRFAEVLKPETPVDSETFLKLMAGPKPGEDFLRRR